MTDTEMGAGEARDRYEDLLKAGAVLPPGTEAADDRAVPLTARTYRHPGLDDRVVVRLVAGELGAAEDLAAGFLGLEPDAEPAEVGLGLRQSLGFPEWVLVHHPEDGHHALGVVPELERAARQAKSRPKAALDAYGELAARLAAAVPHFLPTFYEQAGRVFLAHENAQYAAQMFTRARTAEAEHGLAVDEERLDTVFLEFALAGALPVKVLSAYARELAARVPPQQALDRFTRLCLRRTGGGLPPSAQMANDLRKLARAAGQDADLVEQACLGELLGLPATQRAAAGWWKGSRAALVALARRNPRVRGTLLNLVPGCSDEEMPQLWLEILEESGATAGLCDAALPVQERPQDGTAGWLKRFLNFRERARSWSATPRLPELYPLVERMADVLRAELTASGGGLGILHDVDLLDQLLSLRVPVADPSKEAYLWLEEWAKGDGQRELLAVAADARFRPAFLRGADRCTNDQDGLQAIRMLSRSPGGRPMLAEWMRQVARESSAAGLPQLPAALHRLRWLPAEALVLAEEEVREAVGTDLAPVLARTLRAGLFDELGWPAWEEAVEHLVPKKRVQDLIVADAWPHLIVAGGARARVIGAEGTVLTHDLRIPRKDSWGDPGFHYVDGELLVHWNTRDDGLRGYWHHRADHPQQLEGRGTRGTQMNWYGGHMAISLPLPGGGRAAGGGILHRGDTTLPEERSVITDGISFWSWTSVNSDQGTIGWYEYDPATGERGRKGLPSFLSDALRDAPAGSTFRSGRLLPAAAGAGPACAPVNGLTGWRVVKLPDGSQRGQDLSGRTVTVPDGSGNPVLAVVFPGDERPRAVAHNGWRLNLVDPDGVVTSEVHTDRSPGVFAEGSLLLPPVQYWECLRPRDPQGSEALRRIDRDTAAALLKAAASETAGDRAELPTTIRTLLPVTDDRLAAGIAGAVRHAAAQQAVLDAAADRLDRALTGGLEDEGPVGPSDGLLHDALGGLGTSSGYWWSRPGDAEHTTFRGLRVFGRAARRAAGPVPEGPAVRLHFDGPEVPTGPVSLETLLDHGTALAVRAASATTAPEHRAALTELLRELDSLGVASGRLRKTRLHLDAAHVLTPADEWRDGNARGVVPLGGGACLAVVDHESASRKKGCLFTAYVHDPAGGFEVPAPYTVRSSSAVGEDREAGWLTAFLTELTERGAAGWFPEAAEEFARLTGVTPTMARLVVAGLPQVDTYQRSFLSAEARTTLGVKVAEAAVAKDELSGLDADVRRAVVAALLPADPARLWTDGPDVAAAAEIWNSRVGRRTAVPEALLSEAKRALRPAHWDVGRALPALLDPPAAPELSRDLEWKVKGDRVQPVGKDTQGFTADTLTGSVALLAWLAHRLPVGDPVRSVLPGALAAVRDRLAHPGLMLDLGRYVSLPQFRKAAGTPTEVGKGFERYGAVVLATHDDQPAPGIRTALLDAAGQDPYLPVLRLDDQRPFPAEVALRTARDPRFAALLAEPGEPVAGERGKDGTWWPQDPSRSVPGLVTEAAEAYGIGEDAATLYLTLLAMPDPTDRNTARWTGWRPARLKAARAELAATDLVVQADRARAGRSLFLPGGWTVLSSPRLPLEQWKLPLYDLTSGEHALLGVVVPGEPAAELYRRTWQRIEDGDAPRFEELKLRRGRRRR
ncbi:DNA-binding protein [Streptomyces cavernae]|uniref:DNA-binding protein n=1 Tax=Streptomyces cavernae TaxID=2259034 RepID=UPI00192E6C9D|nr:DNA-binding protein [Streptomyces cavernae]